MSNLALTSKEVRAQVNLIQEVMDAVMKKGIHYGTIPGTDKPTLFKPGSEKILSTFQIAVKPIVEDLSTEDCARFRVFTEGYYRDGTLIGTGIGEASSNEEKYKWRKAICQEEFDATPEDRRREKWFKGKWMGSGYGKAYQVKQVRTEVADIANTVLKMSKKRSQMDLTLTATAASDVFNQDLEDMPEEILDTVLDGETPTVKTPVEPPKPKAQAQPEVVDPAIPNCEGCGIPVAKTVDSANKVVSFCKSKGWQTLCRNCQPK